VHVVHGPSASSWNANCDVDFSRAQPLLRWPGGCGAVLRVRRPSGPTCFCWLERLIEGDRRQPKGHRRASHREASDPDRREAFCLAADLVATGGTLIFYFTDAPELLRGFARADVSANALTWIVVFAGTTYGLAGFAREQVCTFMCLWPRLQGAIWDPDAFTVNYIDYRGEQRTSAKKGAECGSSVSRRGTVSTAASASWSVRSA